jgi:hypothetical protein
LAVGFDHCGCAMLRNRQQQMTVGQAVWDLFRSFRPVYQNRKLEIRRALSSRRGRDGDERQEEQNPRRPRSRHH